MPLCHWQSLSITHATTLTISIMRALDPGRARAHHPQIQIDWCGACSVLFATCLPFFFSSVYCPSLFCFKYAHAPRILLLEVMFTTPSVFALFSSTLMWLFPRFTVRSLLCYLCFDCLFSSYSPLCLFLSYIWRASLYTLCSCSLLLSSNRTHSAPITILIAP